MMIMVEGEKLGGDEQIQNLKEKGMGMVTYNSLPQSK